MGDTRKKGGRMELIIGGVLLVILVVAALAFASKKAQAIPCPGQDPRTCQVFNDSRDWWLKGMGFGAGFGDIITYQESVAGPNNTMIDEPEHTVYACSNLEDDDLDGRMDYGNGPGNDPGCSSPQDDDESSSPPEPPAPPAPPPPPPGGPPPPPPPPEWDPYQSHTSGTVTIGGNPNIPGHNVTCWYDQWGGLDLERPVRAYYVKSVIWCQEPIARFDTTLCAQRARWYSPGNYGYWYPPLCEPKESEAKIRQTFRVSHRCLYTTLRWAWRPRLLATLTDTEGRSTTIDSAHDEMPNEVIWPHNGSGTFCK